ncbi:polyketide synthase [Fusarium sp. NRRL 52700]|nr:polyketide synthase [Fusarium sp. NRRL 52700]
MMRATDSEGIGVLVAISLDTIRTRLSCVADGGHVVSLGGRDKSVAVEIMSRNLAFSSIDILHLKPKVLTQPAERMMQLLAEDKIKLPQPLLGFKVSDINGGLGRAIITWMADRGAKHLLVLSRSGTSSQAATQLVVELKSRGVNIVAPRCDVSIQEDVTVMLQEYFRTMPPIKGCINAAMVLQDAVFQSNMNFQQWNLTMRFKVNTSKNLHELIPKDLDFFILFSSVAGVVGQMASAHYAGGCAYQDTLAKYRRALGQNALSLDIGWMSNIGIIAEKEAY